MPNQNFFQSQKRQAGYTLVEIAMALAAFSIIMLMASQTFSRGFASYRETKKSQANLETAHFALSLIAKELRTSSIVAQTTGATSSRVVFYDYSQKRCIEYVFDEGSGQVTRRDQPFTNDDPERNRTDCLNHVFTGTAQALVSGLSEQYVQIVTSTPPPNPSVGRATFALTLGTTSNAATLQTTVSLRDFNYTSL